MQPAALKYINGYSQQTQLQVQELIDKDELGKYLLSKHPNTHQIRSEKQLYTYCKDLKNQFLKQSQPLSKACYDDKIDVIHNALGLHTQVSRKQGGKLKAKREIRVASLFRNAPQAFLRMILVHELAHFKEMDHNRAFYKLCLYMEPDYHQLEFELRLYLTHAQHFGPLYK